MKASHNLGFIAPLALGLLLLNACSAADPKRSDPAASSPQQQSSDNEAARAENASDAPPPAASEDAMAAEEEKAAEEPAARPPSSPPEAFSISSSGFQNGQAFPATYVAKGGGGNQSPPLAWKGVPAGTASFAIQMVDLDFRNPPFIHWLITDIPASSTSIPAAIPAGNNLALPAEAKGANQAKAYAGPNPPNLHRYEITIYAIKAGETLTLTSNDSAANKTQLEAKSLGKSVIIGTYQ